MDQQQQLPAHLLDPSGAALAGRPGARTAVIELPDPGAPVEAWNQPGADFGVSLVGNVNDGSSPVDLIDLLFLEAFSTGREPFSRALSLENVSSTAPLLPPGARVIRDAQDEGVRSRLAVGEGWTARVVQWRKDRSATVTITAVAADLADQQMALAVTDAIDVPEVTEERVSIGFWHHASHGPRRIAREIDTIEWPQLRGNYSAQVAAGLEPVMTLTPETITGRLLLLHGPPGTGKTTLLRSIARQWRSWCQVECVLDPERLFGDPAYLLNVALSEDEDDEEHGPRWRMLLLEDCDELIRGEAKSFSGQHLSRLLNLTDGLLGQGRNVLVAITTNEDLAALHPAVIRPGRSLAQVEVGRLSPAEATAWLVAAREAEAQARTAQPVADEREPEPGESVPVPGNAETVPGGAETVSGGAETVPGGAETVPGGAETVPGGGGAAPGDAEAVRDEAVPGVPVPVLGEGETLPATEPADAVEWVEPPLPVFGPEGATLAELYALRSGSAHPVVIAPAPAPAQQTGLYL